MLPLCQDETDTRESSLLNDVLVWVRGRRTASACRLWNAQVGNRQQTQVCQACRYLSLVMGLHVCAQDRRQARLLYEPDL